ncbi:MAG: YdeI/OmpD-associated family protein [Flavobacteriales bacterium]
MIKFFPTPASFRKWLEQNHQTETELIVGFYKVKTKKASITWSESVDQALCFGWIDGIRRSIDGESYSIRFTPRKKKSFWSAVNVKKVAELTKLGLMTEAGKKAYSFRTKEMSEIYHADSAPLKLSAAYENVFKKNKTAWEFYEKQPPSYKKLAIYRVMTPKQEKTRLSWLGKVIKASEDQKRIG